MEKVYVVEICIVDHELHTNCTEDIRVFSTAEQARYFIEKWVKNKVNIDSDIRYVGAAEAKEDRIDDDHMTVSYFDVHKTLKGWTELNIIQLTLNDFRGS